MSNPSDLCGPHLIVWKWESVPNKASSGQASEHPRRNWQEDLETFPTTIQRGDTGWRVNINGMPDSTKEIAFLLQLASNKDTLSHTLMFSLLQDSSPDSFPQLVEACQFLESTSTGVPTMLTELQTVYFGWKLWDLALSKGGTGTIAMQALYKVMIKPVVGSNP